jgi:hypothetical protein
MKILKVIYNNETSFILDILKEVEDAIVEEYNISDYREKKKAIPIMVRHGTKQTPLIVFENENLEEICAIWNENNPNWLIEINKILNE